MRPVQQAQAQTHPKPIETQRFQLLEDRLVRQVFGKVVGTIIWTLPLGIPLDVVKASENANTAQSVEHPAILVCPDARW